MPPKGKPKSKRTVIPIEEKNDEIANDPIVEAVSNPITLPIGGLLHLPVEGLLHLPVEGLLHLPTVNELTLNDVEIFTTDIVYDKTIESQRVMMLSPQQREEELKTWLKNTKNHINTKIMNDQAFDVLEFHGVNIVKQVLCGKYLSDKPFGLCGYSTIYAILHLMISSPPFSNENKKNLYDYYTNHVTKFLEEDILVFLADKHGYVLLQEFSQVWNKHKVLANWFNKLFNQLDKYFSGMENDRRSVTSQALYLFYSVVYGGVEIRVRDCILHFISCERAGEIIQRDQLKSCVQMIEYMGMASTEKKIASITDVSKLATNLKIYINKLEEPFLNTSAIFYGCKRDEWLNSANIFAYYDNVENAIKEEETRVLAYLNPRTRIEILKVTLNQLMISCKDRIKESFPTILRSADNNIQVENERYPDIYHSHMKTICFILVHIQQLPIENKDELMNCFIIEFQKYLEHWVKIIMNIRSNFGSSVEIVDGKQKKANTVQGDVDYINNCLNFYRRIDYLTTTCFQNHSEIRVKITGSITSLMNATLDITNEKNTTSIASEMLSSYFDKIMKKSDTANTTSELDKLIAECVLLFKHIRDKDIFIENYRDLLGKRLLNNKSTSIEDEKNVIVQINYLQGANFTGKIDSMIKDMYTTTEKNDAYNLATQGIYKEAFVTQILSSSWKLLKESQFMVFPKNMDIWRATFEQWYLSNRPTMKLKWHVKVGECLITGKFGGKTFDFVVLPIYAIVLNVFNSCSVPNQEFSFDELIEKTRIEEQEVMKRILHSLSCPNPTLKTQVLIKTPAGNTIQTTDKFKVNMNFTNPKRRIQVPTPSLDVDDVGKTTIDKEIEEGRGLVLQACIVRIMKARKTFSHTELIPEVLRQVSSFVPDPKQIKKNIESLIEREYLKRDEEKTNVYVYLA